MRKWMRKRKKKRRRRRERTTRRRLVPPGLGRTICEWIKKQYE